ncbi:MAG: class I SAM-dependent methyltransferase [Thermodesulfobacteriota bacterium]|nr:class I SAM-dependent methyltransferase [Thermodesulfobacteriota bacterium]
MVFAIGYPFALHKMSLDPHHRIDIFEKIAPYYDLLLDLFTIGQYAKFLRKAVKVLGPKKGERILDLSSGTGRVVSWIAQVVGEDGEAIGMDISKGMVEIAKRRYGGSEEKLFLQKDVTQPWEYENYFDGIFTSFALHELPESRRRGVLEKSYLALKERGRMVIADFNPQVSGKGEILSGIFFKLFERGNLNFFFFNQNEALKNVGFKKIKTFPVLAGILQITLAVKK